MNQQANYHDMKQTIQKKKSQVTFETFMIYLILSGISISIHLILYGDNNLALAAGLGKVLVMFVLVAAFITFIRHDIKKYEHQLFLYLVSSLVITQGVYVFSQDRHILTVAVTVFVLLAVMLTTFHPKIILAYSLLAILSFVMSAFQIDPVELTIDNNYIYNVVTSILILAFVYLRTLNLFNWYNRRLEEELEISLQNNMELTALNEEYIATEETMLKQFEEITKLNDKSQFLLKQQTAIIEASEEGLIEYDIKAGVMTMTDKAASIIGLESNDLKLDKLGQYMSEDNFEDFNHAFTRITSKTSRKETLEIFFTNGSIERFINVTMIYYRPDNQDNDYILINLRNITTERKQADKIYDLAYRDNLTGLYNRTGLLATAFKSFTMRRKPFQVVLLDIDNFKYYNDTFGYEVGDALIKGIAESLSNMISEQMLIGRTGSDDFCIIMSEKCNLQSLIGEITTNKHQFYYEETEFLINYSIGIAKSGNNLEVIEIIRHAEIAMYQVKENGKNGYIFYNDDYQKEIQDRLMLINSLEKSIARNEIYLNYQPIINSTTEEIVGFEALVRWQSRKHGFVSPGVFIPLAENTGFINDLGDHIIKAACLFSNKLSRLNDDFYLSVNISTKQLLSDNFAKKFMDILETYQTNPKNIVIEITESAVIENYELAILVLTELKLHGLRIYLDDFGTGYSSLNHLNQMPIDVIKIDKSFIDHIHTNKRHRLMVKNIINMAESFELKTVAEGVEEKDQVELLKSLQCSMLQGYFYDKPLSEEDAFKKASHHS